MAKHDPEVRHDPGQAHGTRHHQITGKGPSIKQHNPQHQQDGLYAEHQAIAEPELQGGLLDDRTAQGSAQDEGQDEAGHALCQVEITSSYRDAQRGRGASQMGNELMLEAQEADGVDRAGDEGQNAPSYPYPTGPMTSIKDLDLRGKDWFTVIEAAHYCGVSESQFRKNAPAYGITPRQFMGKQLYERAELYSAIYGAETWHRSTGAGIARTVTGRSVVSGPVPPSITLAVQKLRRLEERRNRRKL
uniref:HTH psq-type domain-containing protein n=1 Tax=Mycena chlorophos TaxID=658473 RepID=A0ABQ0KYP0_MYCCL|nr:predicted protein [Mycena chlorophos]